MCEVGTLWDGIFGISNPPQFLALCPLRLCVGCYYKHSTADLTSPSLNNLYDTHNNLKSLLLHTNNHNYTFTINNLVDAVPQHSVEIIFNVYVIFSTVSAKSQTNFHQIFIEITHSTSYYWVDNITVKYSFLLMSRHDCSWWAYSKYIYEAVLIQNPSGLNV